MLRDGDGHRASHALDDQRVCVRCTRTFNGNEVKLTPPPDGKHRLQCPTDGCDSFPLHWFFSGSGMNGNLVAAAASSQAEIDFSDW